MILPFPRQQPFNTLRKLPTDPKQDLRPNLYLAAFHGGKIVLADANAFGELRLGHTKAALLPDVVATATQSFEACLPLDLALDDQASHAS